MAKMCRSNYDSWTNPAQIPPTQAPNDGLLEIGAVSGEDFSGKHTMGGHTFTDLKGKCKEGPHRMKFTSVENGVTFTYEGEITTLAGKKTVIGSKKSRAKEAKRPQPPDEEVWVGVKTGT